MILVSWLYGTHASSLRPDRASSPDAARPCPPLPSPRAPRPLVGRRAGRHRARVAGPIWHLAPPLPPAAPLVATRRARPGLRAFATGTERAPQVGDPVARPPPRPGPSRRHGGAKTTGPQSLGRSRGGWTPTMHLVAADARPALACARSPGPAPAAPAGRQLLPRRGPPPAPPAVLRDRASAGPQTRPWAVALGCAPVGPPRRTRVSPWASARERSTRRNEIARVWRRLQGFRRLCSRCEELDVLFLGFIVFALIIDALR